MQAQEIVGQLAKIVPVYTTEFTTSQTITSLEASGGTITATCTDHDYITDQEIYVLGAKEPLANTSITREGNIITITCSVDHKQTKLANGEVRYITIANASPAEYNGDFRLLEIIDKYTLKCSISGTPATPATTSGNILYNSFAFNGLKRITVVDGGTFQYTTTDTSLSSPAQGTITANTFNVGMGANLEYCIDQYTQNQQTGNFDSWLYVVLGNVNYSNTKTMSVADIQGYTRGYTKGLKLNEYQEYYIYIIKSKKDSETGGSTLDAIKRLEFSILKALFGYEPTRYNDGGDDKLCSNILPIGCGLIDYENKSFLVYQMSFACLNTVDMSYGVEQANKTPLQKVDINVYSNEDTIENTRLEIITR